MTVDPVAIVNQALYLQGNKVAPVTGTSPNFDDSAAGIAARYLYPAAVAFVARQWEWDFSRSTLALVLSGNVAPSPWSYEYLYPTAAVQVWQVRPTTLVDVNNPLPTTWIRANAVVSGAQKAVIQTNVQNALAVFNNNPTPDVWDPGFREAVVRWLAAEFAMALAGRPETSANLMQSGAAASDHARMRDG